MNASTIVEAGDEVICLCDTRHARRVMAELRHRERPVHSIMIAGKPSFTLNLARMLKTGETVRAATSTSGFWRMTATS